jgi:hypothetical protein
LFRENIPPQDAEISHRNPLKQTNKTKRVSHFQSALMKVVVVKSLHFPVDYSVFQIISVVPIWKSPS